VSEESSSRLVAWVLCGDVLGKDRLEGSYTEGESSSSEEESGGLSLQSP
jgi:hypothetical protein